MIISKKYLNTSWTVYSEGDFEGFTAEDLRVVVGDGGDVSDVDSTAKLKHLVTPVCASVFFYICSQTKYHKHKN